MNEAPHPLALELARMLDQPVATPHQVLVVGAGSGRNLPPFLRSGIAVDALEPDTERAAALRTRYAAQAAVRVAEADYQHPAALAASYSAALSTNAYLHGRRVEVAGALSALANMLASPGFIAITLGSTRDPRYGAGWEWEPGVWAPTSGNEYGVPHLFLDEDGVLALLAPSFEIITLREVFAGDLVGRWVHPALVAEDTVHWFVIAHQKKLL